MESLLDKRWWIECNNIFEVSRISSITHNILVNSNTSWSLFSDLDITKYRVCDLNINNLFSDAYIKNNYLDGIEYTVYHKHIPHIMHPHVFVALDNIAQVNKFLNSKIAGIFWFGDILDHDSLFENQFKTPIFQFVSEMKDVDERFQGYTSRANSPIVSRLLELQEKE